MGVITQVTIDYGRIYGPLPQSSLVGDPVSHIGSVTGQNTCQTITLQVNPDESKELNEPMEWLCYIHPARTEEEQNMEAYIKEGQIYYRALRMIKAQEELFIWYSKDFAMLIGIPELQRPTNGVQLNYRCPYCGDTYDYPFPLRAHVRFKCPKRRVWSHADNLVTIPVHNKRNDNSPPPSPTYVRHSDIKNNSTTGNSALKRRSHDGQDSECSPGKRSDSDRHREQDQKQLSPNIKDRSFDHNQNVKPNSLISGDGQSAFRKVDKLSPGSFQRSPGLDSIIPTSSRELSFGMSFLPPSSIANAVSGMRSPGATPANILLDSRLPVFPMMPPFHPAMMHLPRPGMFGGIHINPALTGAVGPRSDKPELKQESDLKNIENNNPRIVDPLKSNLFEKSRQPYSVVRTINPIMEKMIHSSVQSSVHSPLSSVNVLQNSCAQCSASFRMTSDLVYHMRSHHKREFDPMKRKREEKLRCNICSESFRERHHLTRHMTSHL